MDPQIHTGNFRAGETTTLMFITDDANANDANDAASSFVVGFAKSSAHGGTNLTTPRWRTSPCGCQGRSGKTFGRKLLGLLTDVSWLEQKPLLGHGKVQHRKRWSSNQQARESSRKLSAADVSLISKHRAQVETTDPRHCGRSRGQRVLVEEYLCSVSIFMIYSAWSRPESALCIISCLHPQDNDNDKDAFE